MFSCFRVFGTQLTGNGYMMEVIPLAQHIGSNSKAPMEDFGLNKFGERTRKINARSSLGSYCKKKI
jgi:hypothetical protein